jgi:hypothetical protein
MWFESNYVLIKIFLNVILISFLLCVSYLENKKTLHLEAIKSILVVLIGVFTFSVAISSSILLPGQIGRYAIFGYNSEWKKISSQAMSNDRIWINTNPHLFGFFRKNAYFPNEDENEFFELKNWIPKKRLMHTRVDQNTFGFQWKTSEEFGNNIKNNNVSTIFLVYSTHDDPKFKFPYQERLSEMIKMPFLRLEKKIPLKNKNLFVFKFVGS